MNLQAEHRNIGYFSFTNLKYYLDLFVDFWFVFYSNKLSGAEKLLRRRGGMYWGGVDED